MQLRDTQSGFGKRDFTLEGHNEVLLHLTKKNIVFSPVLWKFKKNFLNTFIYEPILIKICKNATIMKTQI